MAGLTGLSFINLGSNLITDVAALSGLTLLRTLYLDNNPSLTDLQPLLNNSGLGGGDVIHLSGTAVSCTDVGSLLAKGVTVTSGC
ncbi:MAG: leucine-rich repeat domain-containing protein [Gemmatimonadetes bacterium]|nr:leucine-rich repeat domain-containing protein [Gemmatimonadota bacterium]